MVQECNAMLFEKRPGLGPLPQSSYCMRNFDPFIIEKFPLTMHNVLMSCLEEGREFGEKPTYDRSHIALSCFHFV